MDLDNLKFTKRLSDMSGARGKICYLANTENYKEFSWFLCVIFSSTFTHYFAHILVTYKCVSYVTDRYARIYTVSLFKA
jgi:hypothetical protein